MLIDFRSDTVTRPSPLMREAMLAAPLGDDVFGEDPSVNLLQETVAGMFGMEAALFCPSGTMTNQVAIKCHTQPGDEVICDENSHIYQYEGGGIAFHSGASVKLLPGHLGRITAIQVMDAIQPDDPHRPHSSLVSLENTSNRGGGSCYDLEEIRNIRNVCTQNNLALHLDGARLWNALIAKNENAKDYGVLFNSISVCLSKSLGCPAGSLLLGSKEFIFRAKRVRKVFGGGMRQAGILAAAGLFALTHNIERLQADHQHARLLADALQQKPYVSFILPVDTNIIIFELTKDMPAKTFVARLKEYDILGYAIAANRVRLVLHMDISPAMVERTIDLIHKL